MRIARISILYSIVLAVATPFTFGQVNNYNLKLGPVYFDLTATTGFSYNSNISYVENNEISDFIIQSSINANGLWELTPNQDLNFDLGIGYAYYLENTELSGVENTAGFSPQSELSLEVIIGNFYITLYDEFAYRTNASEVTRLNINDDPSSDRDFVFFERIENEIGAQIESDFNILQARMNLGRRDLIALSDEFSFTENTEYFAGLQLTKQLRETFLVGIGGQYTNSSYNENLQNDGNSFSIGPFFNWAMTEQISIDGSISQFLSSFENDGQIEDSSDPSGLNYSLGITHNASKSLTHKLRFSQSRTNASQSASLSNLTVSRGISYTADWSGLKNYSFRTEFSYFQEEDSASLFSENAEIWSANLRISKQLSKKLTLSFLARSSNKQSDQDDRDYLRNEIGITLSYDL